MNIDKQMVTQVLGVLLFLANFQMNDLLGLVHFWPGVWIKSDWEFYNQTLLYYGHLLTKFSINLLLFIDYIERLRYKPL